MRWNWVGTIRLRLTSHQSVGLYVARTADYCIRLYSVSRKILPPRSSGDISPTIENFKIKYFTPTVRSYPRKITEFYPVICNCDKIMPY